MDFLILFWRNGIAFSSRRKTNRLRTWSCHLGRCWPLGNSLALVIKWTNGTEIFGNSGKSEKKIIPRMVSHFLSKTFHRNEPFHLNSSQKSRIFHTNGTRSKWPQVKKYVDVIYKMEKMFGLKVTLITETVTKINFITCLDFEANYPLYHWENVWK